MKQSGLSDRSGCVALNIFDALDTFEEDGGIGGNHGLCVRNVRPMVTLYVHPISFVINGGYRWRQAPCNRRCALFVSLVAVKKFSVTLPCTQ